MGWHLSPRYGQVILVSGCPVLTAVKWWQHWCAISFLLCPQTSCMVVWLPHFLGWVDLLNYPLCSAGMRESSASTQFQKRGGLLPSQPTGDGDRSIGHHSQSSCLSVRVSFALFRRNTVRRVAPSCHFGFTRFPQPKLTSTKCGFLKTQTSTLRSSWTRKWTLALQKLRTPDLC